MALRDFRPLPPCDAAQSALWSTVQHHKCSLMNKLPQNLGPALSARNAVIAKSLIPPSPPSGHLRCCNKKKSTGPKSIFFSFKRQYYSQRDVIVTTLYVLLGLNWVGEGGNHHRQLAAAAAKLGKLSFANQANYFSALCAFA